MIQHKCGGRARRTRQTTEGGADDKKALCVRGSNFLALPL